MRGYAHPSSGVHLARNMWSVKWLPNPGSARIASSSPAVRGCGWRSTVGSNGGAEVIAVTVVLFRVEGKRLLTNRYASGHARCDGLAHPLGRAALCDVGLDSRVDPRGRLGPAEVLQQQGAGEDRGRRVGLALAGDVG